MKRIISTGLIAQKLSEIIKDACTVLDDCTLNLLRRAKQTEDSDSAAGFALDVLCKNIGSAKENLLPLCQDTGMAVVFIDIGQDVSLTGEFLDDAINQAVKKAYSGNYFRMSVLDPLSRKNTGDNTPAVIHTRLVPGDKVILSFMAKGFGSENMSALYMLKPSGGIDAVIDSVIDCVQRAGANPCPPIVVGVGIGGTADKAAELAKRSLLRPTGQPSDDGELASLEQTLLSKINKLPIGAQGFGGNNTALAVHIEKFPTHLAGLPVSVNIQCHCVRARTVEL